MHQRPGHQDVSRDLDPHSHLACEYGYRADIHCHMRSTPCFQFQKSSIWISTVRSHSSIPSSSKDDSHHTAGLARTGQFPSRQSKRNQRSRHRKQPPTRQVEPSQVNMSTSPGKRRPPSPVAVAFSEPGGRVSLPAEPIG
ncbi:hypothetical protein N657DRAFT_648477 [Parathielavia appendiculata]|uniref:Uncharacterized protein n=1 Tax=Parathielavia appendiculata TaxID=2587402 RepID=A0AAN6TVT6_9PEZI|nr:hypothetical protein N657DRAFT_648477 [Parathielavia appendiculata]